MIENSNKKSAKCKCFNLLFICCEYIYFQCLAYIELPFSEDVREYVFPSLSEINKLRKEQLDAIDKLIDCMDLS